MWTLVAVLVAFLLVSVGVAALARSTTARWERERRRSDRARRRAAAAAAAPPVRPHRVAGRLGRVLATARPAARVRVLQRAAGHGLASARQRGGQAVPQLTAALRHVHLDHGRPTRLASRVVHRRRRRGGRAGDEPSGPAG